MRRMRNGDGGRDATVKRNLLPWTDSLFIQTNNQMPSDFCSNYLCYARQLSPTPVLIKGEGTGLRVRI
jgi:hypothetical protein